MRWLVQGQTLHIYRHDKSLYVKFKQTTWEVVNWIMRYLQRTTNLRLTLGREKPNCVGYIDSDLVRCLDCRKSTSGYMVTFFLGNCCLVI